jgi:transcriptional regulator with AAA-type ATPase domain/class 3 adenylate cyclase/tetratricopeptide (TPR) repeat protein
LIGSSPGIVALREDVRRLLQRPGGGRALPSILILGETGTGKGLLAGAIHRAGPRRDGPFVAVNCAAIPETMLEAELFGFERGAFTDARQSKPGLMQTAHRGTMFLDEIGLLPEPLQGKLLTVLEERAVRRLGSTRSDPVDIAIVAATSEDLDHAVRELRFSEALYHRLSVLTLRLPPLRERGPDVLRLAEHFLARAAATYNVSPRTLTPEARAALLAYPWPGNVRELNNRMERVTLLAEPGLVTCAVLGLPEPATTDVRGPRRGRDARQLRDRIGSVERDSLIEALGATGGNITRAAARLGVPPTTLRYRLKKHGLFVESRPSGVVEPGGPGASQAAGVTATDPRSEAPGDGSRKSSLPVGGEAERRHVTVLSCRFASADMLRAPAETEDLFEAVRAFHGACAEVIRRFEGHVAQYVGDGLLVYFGYPRAHEDGAQRAVRAALGIVDELATFNGRPERTSGPRLIVRVAIHSGVVVMGEVGTGETRARIALGEVAHVVDRLQALAEAETVVITSATYRLVGASFRCEDLGPHVLTGPSPPLRIYRLLGEGAAQSRFDVAATGPLTPLVGRQQEVGLLWERWERARDGLGQVLLLGGEPGIGKSRLVQVLKERLAGEPHGTLDFRGSPYHQNSAFHPVVEGLQHVLKLERDGPREDRLRTLEEALDACGFSLDDTVPLFAGLLSLRVPDRYPPLNLTSALQKQKTQEALLAWLLKQMEGQPTLCVWEDLQWLDPSTLELLWMLLEQVPTIPALVLLTFRPEFTPPGASRSHWTPIALTRLTRREAETMVQTVAGARTLPADLLAQMVARTDGVPLFVEELTKAVLESALEPQAGRHEPTASVTIPSTLHDSLMARLDRLGPGKQLAQLASILGREFTYDLVRAVSPFDGATLRRELARLVGAELLYQRGSPPQARYVFKHALIQEAASESLLSSTKREYHRRVAEVLKDRFPEIRDTHPELLAHHYAHAGLRPEAVAFRRKAAQRAIERSANEEAIAHLADALTLLAALPESTERSRHELDLQMSLGGALTVVRGSAAVDVERAYLRARSLCQDLRETAHGIRVLSRLAAIYDARGSLQAAQEMGEECFGLAHRNQDPEGLRQAHQALGRTLYWRGDIVAARVHLEAAFTLSDPSLDRSLNMSAVRLHPPGHSRMTNLCMTALLLYLQGYPDEARKRNEDALALAESLSHPYSLVAALLWATWLHLFCGELAMARERLRRALALAIERRFPPWEAMGRTLDGWLTMADGREEEGIAQMRRGFDALRTMGLAQAAPSYLILLAQAYLKVGQPAGGLGALDEALGEIDRTGARWEEAALYRVKGQLLLAHSLERQRDAESCFRKALEIARLQQARSLELRAAISLGDLWRSQGKPEPARRLLTEVYGSFTEGFDTTDLREAKRLLEALG